MTIRLFMRVPTRERIGGTTFLRYAYGRALAEGRDCDAADFDRRGQTFRTFFREQMPAGLFFSTGTTSGAWGTCAIPYSGEDAAMVAGLLLCIDRMVERKRSVVLDWSGGDDLLLKTARDLSLSAVCAEAGIALTAVAMVGPGAQDVQTVMRLVRSRLFEPSELLLVCNGGLVDAGDDPLSAYAAFVFDGDDDKRDPEIRALQDEGAKVCIMPRNPFAVEAEAARGDFFDLAQPTSAFPVAAKVNTRVWLYGNERFGRVVKVGMAQAMDHVKDVLP